MLRVAVIPARGGSKRIPRKNIKDFCGKPMIAYSIEAALAAGCFDRVIVSTDDPEVAAVAQTWGAEVPFVRPAHLADDNTATIPVINHAIEWLTTNGSIVDFVCCIYATAPFISADDIQQGWQKIQHEACDYCFSVTTYAHPIQRALKANEQGQVTMLQPEHFYSRSQDLEEAWHDSAQFYWGLASAWQAEKPLFHEQSRLIVVPRYRVIDIDTPEDWHQAELLYKAMQEPEIK